MLAVKSTCQPCRQAKLKCDMGLPCKRCTRLGLACTATVPSRRGKKRKGAAEAAAPPKEGASHMGEAVIDILSRAAPPQSASSASDAGAGGAAGAGRPSLPGVVYLARDWIAIALRKRSVKLLTSAFNICAEAGVPLDTVLSGEGAYLLPMFVPGDWPVLQSPALQLSDIPAARLGIGDDSTALVRCCTAGHVSYVCTPKFEEAIATGAQLNEVYLANKQDAMRLLLVNKDDYAAVIRQAGSMVMSVKQIPMEEPLVLEFPKVQVKLRSQRFALSRLRHSLFITGGSSGGSTAGGGTGTGGGGAGTHSLSYNCFELVGDEIPATATATATVAVTATAISEVAPPEGEGGTGAEDWSLDDVSLVENLDTDMLPQLTESVLKGLYQSMTM